MTEITKLRRRIDNWIRQHDKQRIRAEKAEGMLNAMASCLVEKFFGAPCGECPYDPPHKCIYTPQEVTPEICWIKWAVKRQHSEKHY